MNPSTQLLIDEIRKLFGEQNAWFDRRFAVSIAPTPAPSANASVATAPAPSAAASAAPAPAPSAVDTADGANPSADQKLVQCGPVDTEYKPASVAFSTCSFITACSSNLTGEKFVSGKGGDATAYPAPNATIFANQIHYNANAEPYPEPEVEASVSRSTQMLFAMGQILSISSSPIVSNSTSSSEPARRAPHPARATPYRPDALKARAAADSPYRVYCEHTAISHTLSIRVRACLAPRQQQVPRGGRGRFPSLVVCATVGMNIVFVGAKWRRGARLVASVASSAASRQPGREWVPRDGLVDTRC